MPLLYLCSVQLLNHSVKCEKEDVGLKQLEPDDDYSEPAVGTQILCVKVKGGYLATILEQVYIHTSDSSRMYSV